MGRAEDVEQLVGMGFGKSDAEAALRTAAGNVDVALTLLLDGSVMGVGLEPATAADLKEMGPAAPGAVAEGFPAGTSVFISPIGQSKWFRAIVLECDGIWARCQYVDDKGKETIKAFNVDSPTIKLDDGSALPEPKPTVTVSFRDPGPGDLIPAAAAGGASGPKPGSDDERKDDPEPSDGIKIPFDFPFEWKAGLELEFRDVSSASKGLWKRAKVLSVDPEVSPMVVLELIDDKKSVLVNVIGFSEFFSPKGSFCNWPDASEKSKYATISARDFVNVFALSPTWGRKWAMGDVIKVAEGGKQVMVQYENCVDMYKDWFGVGDDALSFDDFKVSSTGRPTVIIPTSGLDVGEGGMLRVLDGRGVWCMAEVKKVEASGLSTRFQIHYERWGVKFDEWLSMERSSFRLRSLAEVDADKEMYPAEESLIQKQADKDFAKKLLANFKLKVVTVRDDGNCLYRSFAHAVLGDQNLHGIMREKCVTSLMTNAESFAGFVDDIVSYASRQAAEGEWGGQTEILALSLAVTRPVEIYQQSSMKQPTFVINDDKFPGVPPVRLSYHGKQHYNVLDGPVDEAKKPEEKKA